MRDVGSRRGAFTPKRRIAVYAHAYTARLAEVLAGDYPALRAWLGADAFERLAHRYVAAHPSRHPTLNRFGASLPAFLRRSGPHAPFATGLARFELAITRAFDAQEHERFAADALHEGEPAAWAQKRLRLHASVQLLRVPASVVDHFAAWRRGTVQATRSGAAHVLVWRRDDDVLHTELPRAAAQVLRRLQRGCPLWRALAALREHEPLQAWFARWRRDGVFGA